MVKINVVVFIVQTLHQYAAQWALERLKPPLEPKDKSVAELKRWVNNLRQNHTSINSILAVPSETFPTCTLRWHKHLALQLFVEHIVLNFEEMLPFAKRLQKVCLLCSVTLLG